MFYGAAAALVLVGLLRPRPAPASFDATAVAAASVDAEIEVRAEDVAIREWLSDVRGCLEREAATRGLALDLRCERSLPDDVRSDPAWLGGLVVAMGREALDATADERVLVEVLEEADDALRFEVDAGGTSLVPVGGMQEVAACLGGRLESGRAGRLALVLPASLA